MAGRPSLISSELTTEICALIIEGHTIRQICNRDGMPDASTVMRWLGSNEEFRDQYARAKEIQLALMEDELVDIADDGTNDWITRENQDGSTFEVLNAEHVQRSRLRIDTRKWLMSKLAPKKYGDKVSAEVTGADGAPLIPTAIQIIGIESRTDDKSGAAEEGR